MNYYMTNGITSIEQDHSFSFVIHKPSDYRVFSDTRHEELVRCCDCHIKYDMHVLKRIGIGKFICKYCEIRENV